MFSATVKSLVERQHESLREMIFTEVQLERGLEDLALKGLETLYFGTYPSISSSNWCLWFYDLLKMNRGSLRQFQLGAESCLAKAYTGGATDMGPSLSLSHMGLTDPDNSTFFDLESLWLCNINLFWLIRTVTQQIVDWSALTSLTLDSCPRSGPGLLLLKEFGMKLKSFSLRYEAFNEQTPVPDIEAFLLSFKGLRSLQVLLEGFAAIDLENILKSHGKTLKTLVWDERRGPRRSMAESTATIRGATGHLEAIASSCPELTSLGISLDWVILCNSHDGINVAIPIVMKYKR